MAALLSILADGVEGDAGEISRMCMTSDDHLSPLLTVESLNATPQRLISLSPTKESHFLGALSDHASI